MYLTIRPHCAGWVCGGMLGHLVDYWHYTGDDTYNDLVKQALMHQVGEDKDYMPANQTRQLGNDDQGYWAMTAMTAAERIFPDPPKDHPQWLALVQAVFNEFVGRWDTQHCDGGLRWQIFNFNSGWQYKNSVSNGCFFNLAARLARYTGNNTYADWASKVWDWEVKTKLISEDKWAVKDGVTIQDDNSPCYNDLDSNEWSYNSGTFLLGAAALYDFTSDEKWKKRATGLLDHGLSKFVQKQVVYEQYCEAAEVCDDDQRTFKGYFLRSLSTAAQIIPEFKDKIQPVMKASAKAAAVSCSGENSPPEPNHPPFNGQPGTSCGFRWVPQGNDGTSGVPQQMNALAALVYALDAKKPVSKDTGGTSKGDPNAGISDKEKTKTFDPITIGDRVGAGFLTTLALAGVIGGCSFLII